MNIEQLNGSGQHVSVFVVTAVVALVVTGSSWFAIEQMNSYRKWRRRSPDTAYSGKTQFALVVRLAMLAYLVSDGLLLWMFRSGAWWRILINHRSQISTRSTRWGDRRYHSEALTAGEYVSKNITEGYPTSMHLARGGDVQWTKVEQD